MLEPIGLAAISVGRGLAGFKEKMGKRNSLGIYNVGKRNNGQELVNSEHLEMHCRLDHGL